MGKEEWVVLYDKKAMPICLRLFYSSFRGAAFLTDWSAGKSNETRIAMMAITTRSSISVNPGRFGEHMVLDPTKTSETGSIWFWRTSQKGHLMKSG